MRLIVGLGNPGREYAKTRHNVGWWALDHLADAWRFDAWRRDGDALASDGRFATTRVRLLKPQTFMNLSGAALRPYLRRATWSPAADLLVVVDDVALPVGAIRLRAMGSAGGHNGLKSIEATVGTREYARLRIGIGAADDHSSARDLSNFVLDRFREGERETILTLLPTVTAACEMWVRDGIARAMNVFNRREPREEEQEDDAS
ncbi:MAG: Peptidyl-tRNA hydrolase [Gemmatimonadaceae bacterium]|nr:Peptidyl-tRNA hydrolase [Gemmatimonadaceae bacterium]